MGFNRKDLQDDDDFNFDDGDDFNFDDKPNGDAFKFDDDAPDIDLDNAKDTGFGFENDDMPELNEEGSPPTRTNRTFIYIAALMIILFLIGLGAVLFLATRPTGPTPIDLTRSAIETQNADTQLLILQTQTASVQIALAQTQTASVPTTVPPTETPTREPTVTPTPEPPTMDATQAAANALLTQVADQATQTALASQITPTVAAPNQDAVALTGTALAILLGQGDGATGNDLTATALAAGIGGGLASPTAEGGIGPVPTRLPQTGFFDDVGTGSNVGLIALLALGLFGVIGVSRVVRASNK
ncbi:MAG: hypothetical protein H0X30_32435 [Anaerolineae bacterium]|nr:hypothetical protein [Anaerolineae bacterium]